MLLYSPGTNNIIFIQILGQILMIYYTPCFNSRQRRALKKRERISLFMFSPSWKKKESLMLRGKIFIIRSKCPGMWCRFCVRRGNRWWLLRYYRVKFLFFSTFFFFFYFFELTLGGKTNKKEKEKNAGEKKSRFKVTICNEESGKEVEMDWKFGEKFCN